MDVFNEALLSYLQQRGFSDTAQHFLDENRSVQDSNVPRKEFVPEVDDVDTYSNQYSDLHEFIESSLDAFREELWPILWAVFLHFYIELVSKGFSTQAVAFRKRFEQDHIHDHYDEVQEMAMVSTKEQLDTSDFIHRALRFKVNIAVSRYSVELLIDYLFDRKLLLVLSVINRRTGLTYHDSERPVQPTLKQSVLSANSHLNSSAQNPGIIANVEPVESSKLNSVPVKWGVPSVMRISQESPDTSSNAPTRSEFIQNIVEPQLEYESNMRAKVNPLVTAEAGSDENANQDDGTNTAAAESAPNETGKPAEDGEQKTSNQEANESEEKKNSTVPPVLNGVSKKRRRQLMLSASLSAVDVEHESPSIEWPSIAFFTFLNVRDGLISVDISLDSQIVVAGFDDSSIQVWDHRQDEEHEMFGMQSKRLLGHSGPVYGVSISRDGRMIASCSEDGTIRLWVNLVAKDQESAASVKNLDTKSLQWRNVSVYRVPQVSPLWDVKLSPWGYYFVTASNDKTAKLYSTESTTPLRLFVGHLADVSCVEWHPNCELVVTGSWDKTVRLWGINDGECVRLFCGHTGPITSLAVDPSGRYIASGGQDHLVIVWDISTGQQVSVATGHTAPVWSLSYSLDSKLLASGGGDNAIRVWDSSNLHGESKLLERNNEDSNRVFHTKYTPVTCVSFKKGNLLIGAGTFSLPVMHT